MGATSIEWTATYHADGTVEPGHTINPIRARNKATGAVGHFCEKISPGCGHCYSSEWNENRFGTGLPFLPIHRDQVELFLDEKKLSEVLRRKKPTKYFWCDMTDLFLDGHTDEWIDRCFATMALTPQHTHMVLTKRADRMKRYFDGLDKGDGWLTPRQDVIDADVAEITGAHGMVIKNWPLPNVWLGVSVENQQYADERIPLLLQCPAAIRFLSCEPLLGPVDLLQVAAGPLCPQLPTHRIDVLRRGTWNLGYGFTNHSDMPGKVDWVIVGGESGSRARPCHTDDVRSIVEQCKAAGCPAFLKQLGSEPFASGKDQQSLIAMRDKKGGDMEEFPPDLRIRQFPGKEST